MQNNNNIYGSTYLNTAQGRVAFANTVGGNLTEVQIAQALSKWSSAILPYPETFPVFGFSAVNALVNQNIQIDGGYALIISGISCLDVSSDIDTLINSISVNTTTNLIGSNPLPVKMITQFTGIPVPFPFTAPPSSTITIQVQNGGTTANNSVYITLWTLRIPVEVINDIKTTYGIS